MSRYVTHHDGRASLWYLDIEGHAGLLLSLRVSTGRTSNRVLAGAGNQDGERVTGPSASPGGKERAEPFPESHRPSLIGVQRFHHALMMETLHEADLMEPV
jgi:hypothetical protein